MDRLYRSEIPAITASLRKQRMADDYRDMRDHWAFLAAVITNAALGLAASMSGKRRKPKMVTPEDFISKDFKRLMEELLGKNEARPRRKTDRASLIEAAKEKRLKGPW